MPVHLSADGLSVLDEDGHVVSGGHHSSRAEARAHEQAMNINMRREEGRPVAPKLGKGIRLPNGEFDAQKRDINPDVGGGVDVDKLPDEDFVDPERRRFPIKIAGDVADAVSSYGRADPKIPFDKFKERLTAIARRKGFESSLPEEWKEEKTQSMFRPSPVDEQDPNGYVDENYRDASKGKSSFLVDPTEDDLYVWLTEYEDTPRWFKGKTKGNPPYVDPDMGDMLTDRAFYHHSPERYQYKPAPDWNDDTTALPDAWVRAHPYGSTYKKDAHGEYFDSRTDFHDRLLTSIPVSYYHNYDPSGEPNQDPISIGKTIARKYRSDGRWDKIRFDDGMPKEIKARIANALAEGTLRASPTVVPDFHEVDQNGHIKDWLTGSIAVLDARGARQPANPKAIGIPAMKALFKAQNIPFPKEIEKMTKANTAKRVSLKALFKAFMKALNEETTEEPRKTLGRTKAEQDSLYHEHKGMADGEGHSHERGDEPHEHEEGTEKALFENSNPEESASAPYGLGNTYWWERYTGPQTDRDRYDGGAVESFQKGAMRKDVQPLAQELENIMREEEAEDEGNPLKDPDVRLDWANQQKTMKAQIHALQSKADNSDFREWFSRMLQDGKVIPSEFDELRYGYMQMLSDDRTARPLMKSANGKSVSRVRVFQRAIERREPKFGERKLTGAEMKALGYQFGGFDQTQQEQEWSDARRKELLAQSPLGNKILQDEKKV